MSPKNSQELHVSIDVGCYQHHVSVGLANGCYLGSFEINHDKAGFADFFEKVEYFKLQSNGNVSVAMEGYNGHARPLDKMIQSSAYRLLNIAGGKGQVFHFAFFAARLPSWPDH